VRALLEQGHEVIIIDTLSSGHRQNVPREAELIKTNVGNPNLAEKLAGLAGGQIDAVFHLAAQIDVRKSVEDPVADANANIMETLKLLGLCRDLQVKRFIFASSGGAIYGQPQYIPTKENDLENPGNPYGVAKLAIEKYLHVFHQLHGLSYAALRLSNVYGPFQNSEGEAGVVAIFSRKIIAGELPVIYGNGLQTRDFVYVGDVVRAMMFAMESDVIGSYNIGTASETTVYQVCRHLQNIAGDKAEPLYRLARLGEQMRSCLDYSKAYSEMGWRPQFDIEEGLRRTFEWFSEKSTSRDKCEAAPCGIVHLTKL